MDQGCHKLYAVFLREALAVVVAILALLSPPLGAADDAWSGLRDALQRDLTVEPGIREALTAFYDEREPPPLWFGSARADSRRAELLAGLEQAGQEGLDPADYLTAELRQACDQTAPKLLHCELGLSDSLLRYASDVRYGRLQASEVDPHWYIPQQQALLPALLSEAAVAADLSAWLSQLPPVHAQYRALRDVLARFREMRQQPPWLQIPEGSSLHPGDRGDRVRLLRERMATDQPDLQYQVPADEFDAALEQAVMAFQVRHGLDRDGIVGPQTRAALNISLDVRINQIQLNMERWRWMPRELGERHVLVNLAGFELTLVDEGQPALRSRVINGRPDRTSPVFQSRIRQLVVNPEWTVPRRLAVEDFLPQLQRDPKSLEAKQIQVLQRAGEQMEAVDPMSVDWRQYHKNNFPFVLRQAPGVHNSLGQLKFLMPNPFEIYIHDTPAKGLFAKSVRTLSSGCVRVERPIDLAVLLLGGPDRQMRDSLQARIDGDATAYVPISPEVPVYLVYLTAWVDEEGNLQLRNDVYGRDLQMRDSFSFL